MPLEGELAPSRDGDGLRIWRVRNIASHICARDILDGVIVGRVADISSSDISDALVDAVFVQVPDRGVSVCHGRQGSSADDVARVLHFGGWVGGREEELDSWVG